MTEPTSASFASDNYAGAHPEVLAAVAAANVGHQPAYGADAATESLRDLIREHFGSRAEVYPMLTGTGANVVALQAMARPWEAVVCTSAAHIHLDEGGAPEKVAGLKLWPVVTNDAKLTPESLDTEAWGYGDVHRAQPTILSLTQSTESGTVYSPDELAALVDRARSHDMRVHLDGARLANAAAHLGVPLRAITTDVDVDVVCFGGTKNGALGAEAIVVLNPDAVPGVEFLRKSAMQLSSKMRFVSAQLVALLTDELWRRNAEHANAMAELLYRETVDIPGIDVLRPPQANSVFAVLPPAVTKRLQQQFPFYIWDRASGEVRWMCAWDTTVEDVATFARAIAAESAREK
jgi:threonine aldolase